MNELRSTVPEEAAFDAEHDQAHASPPLIEAEDLLEEISIDGMCGVY
ncbi:mycofactocin precursor MftA [Streptomyces hyaluromycini]|nr:mycofactocin precursor MftA [Streptomyces hyaluromycini]